MNNVQIRWILGGSLMLALSACEVHVGKCEKDDAGECVDLFPDDEDGGDQEEDAGLDGGRSDGGKDGGSGDGGKNDAGVDSGAGGDGGGGDGGAESLTIDEFCEAFLSRTLAWRDRLAECCINEAADDRDFLLSSVFLYAGDTTLVDCIDGRDDQLQAGRIAVDATKLQACADEFVKQLPSPPEDCPSQGFDLEAIEASSGHGLQRLVQIPVCREALVGKVKRDQPCTDSLECISGLRCMPAMGDTTTCQPAASKECTNGNQCIDGTVCVGQGNSGGKSCVSVDELPLTSNQKCDLSSECSEDLVCRVVEESTAGGVDRNGCTTPDTGNYVCKQR